MPDPIGDMIRQMNTNALQMNKMMSQAFMQGLQAMDAMNPLNVLKTFAEGSGYYTAKMSTSELKRKNIFGE